MLLAEVHHPRYISSLKRASESGGGSWDADTYISPGSYRAAILAAGAATDLWTLSCRGRAQHSRL